jgi:hypothetical protein
MNRQCPSVHLAADGSPLDPPALDEILASNGKILCLQCPVCLRTYETTPGFHEFLDLCANGMRVEQVMCYLSCTKAQARRTMRQFERGRLVYSNTMKIAGKGKRKRTARIWTIRRETAA